MDDATGEPLAEARAAVLDSAGVRVQSTPTDGAGRFVLELSAPGAYALTVTRLGYAPIPFKEVEVRRGEVVDIEVRLAARPIHLEPVTGRATPAGSRLGRLEEVGFYARRRWGHGRFMTADQIEDRARLGVTDLLRTEPSVVHVYDYRKQRQVVYFRGMIGRAFDLDDTGPCLPLLVLDGTRIRDSGALDELVHPADIAGIELYPRGHGAPARYTGVDARCGVIIIWTRRT